MQDQGSMAPPPVPARGSAMRALAALVPSPTRAFGEIARGAPWLPAFLVTAVLSVIGSLLSKPLQEALLEQRMAQMPEAQREAMAGQAGLQSVLGLVFTPVGLLLALLVSAGIFFLVLRAFGHRVAFKPLFSGLNYASVLGSGLSTLLVGILVTLKAGSTGVSGMEDAPRIGLDLIGGEGFLRGILSAVNPFSIWWLVILIYGVAVLVGKKPGAVATAVGVAGILWLLLAGLLSGVGYTFGGG